MMILRSQVKILEAIQMAWIEELMNIDCDKLISLNNLPPRISRVVVAMSGGVDYSTTAGLLHNAGFIIGVTVKLYEAKKKAQKRWQELT